MAGSEILMDGGIRRGTDVLKALALGARAVLIGRPVLWGLGAGGTDGVLRMVELIRGELVSAMGHMRRHVGDGRAAVDHRPAGTLGVQPGATSVPPAVVAVTRKHGWPGLLVREWPSRAAEPDDTGAFQSSAGASAAPP